jgi:hypothetical protein
MFDFSRGENDYKTEIDVFTHLYYSYSRIAFLKYEDLEGALFIIHGEKTCRLYSLGLQYTSSIPNYKAFKKSWRVKGS